MENWIFLDGIRFFEVQGEKEYWAQAILVYVVYGLHPCYSFEIVYLWEQLDLTSTLPSFQAYALHLEGIRHCLVWYVASINI